MEAVGLDATTTKRFFSGTHRTRDPEETLEDFGRFMPVMGITRLANVTGLDCVGIPVYVAMRPNSRGLATSQGKGLVPAAAKVSALMESIEGWHGERPRGALRQESYRSLRQEETTVDVALLARRTGVRFREDVATTWIRGYDLLESETCWVPLETVSTNFVLQPGVEPAFFQSSNGLASGNVASEAIAHALCEVLERDAVQLWHLRGGVRCKADQVASDTVDDADCRELMDRLCRAGNDLGIWKVTSDSGIPAFSVALFDSGFLSWQAAGLFSGHGCHLDPAVALARALTEAAQSRLTMISGSRDDLLPADYRRSRKEGEWRALRDAVLGGESPHSFLAQRSLACDSVDGDLERLCEALYSMGLGRAVVVDLTDPALGIPVVKVVVPGLEALGSAQSCVPGRRARMLRQAAATAQKSHVAEGPVPCS